MFKFKLEAVLQKRIRKLENAQLALAKEVSIELNIKNTLQMLRKKLLTGQNELVTVQSNGIRVDELILRRWQIDGLKIQIIETEKNLVECEKRVRERRLDVAEASKNKKMIEKLKENAYKEYLKEESRKEKNQIEEYSILNYARKVMIKNA